MSLVATTPIAMRSQKPYNDSAASQLHIHENTRERYHGYYIPNIPNRHRNADNQITRIAWWTPVYRG